MQIILAIFFILHGLVHLLYAGQSGRFFELRPGMTWPNSAWVFSTLLGDPPTRRLVTVSLALAALGFFTGSLGLFFHLDWWRLAAVGAAGFSCVLFILFWDGKSLALPEQGGIGLLISLAILGIALFLK